MSESTNKNEETNQDFESILAKKLKIPYYQVAKQIFMEKNKIPAEEAEYIIATQTYEEIEAKVNIEEVLECAIFGIINSMKMSEECERELSKFVFEGRNTQIAWILKRMNKLQYVKSMQELYNPQSVGEYFNKCIMSALFCVHDKVTENNIKKFENNTKKIEHIEQKYKFMPSELIGWENAKKDLVFVKPIFDVIGYEINEKDLEDLYNVRVKDFLLSTRIETTEDLSNYIISGEALYYSLPNGNEKFKKICKRKYVNKEIIPAIEKHGIGKVEKIRENVVAQIISDPLLEDLGRLTEEERNMVEKYIQQEEVEQTEKNSKKVPIVKKVRKGMHKGEGKLPQTGELWICPSNDLESYTIAGMLKKAKKDGRDLDVLETRQGWGASWKGLEHNIKTKIMKARKEGKNIFGVELQGDSKGAVNIDHHIYGNDDRSNPKSSIEQVADVLGVDLTLEQKFIAANDKGFIPEMQRLGAELGLEGEDLQAIIDNVRMKDRIAQGITLEQEEQAQGAVEALGDLSEKRELIIMDLPHSKTATVTDRLFGKYDNLLVICGDGEIDFFGTTDIINALNEKYKQVDKNGNSNCWCGGQLDKGSGYWGGTEIDQDLVKETVASEVEKNDLNRDK